MKTPRRWLRPSPWCILPPLLVGGAVLAYMVLTAPGPRRRPETEVARELRILPAPQVDLVPRLTGFGTARPTRVWRAVAEVKGRVVAVHPDLDAGKLLAKGTELLRIDRREYDLSVARLEADLGQVEAQLEELGAKEANLGKSLEIESESLELARRRLERTREAARTQAVSQAQLDQEERDVLAQRLRQQELANSLALLPAQRKVLEATRAVKSAALAQARLDLERTAIAAPFDLRLAEVSIEEGQYLIAGETLFEAHSIDAVEVEARVRLEEVRTLVAGESAEPITGGPIDMESVRERFAIAEVEVRLIGQGVRIAWEARFDRIREIVDPETRTVGIVVRVDRPYDGVVPGRRPPLLKGMFCEVEIRGRSRPDVIALPRSAVQEGHVYVIDGEDRLRRRKVDVAYALSGLACIGSGVKEGDRVVVSDPTPAVEGTLVRPSVDEELLQRVEQDARGKESRE